MNTIILTKLLRHIETYSLKKSLVNTSIKDFRVLAILDKMRIHARTVNLKYLDEEWEVIHQGQNPRSERLKVYHHKRLRFLELPLEIIVETKSKKNKKHDKKKSKEGEEVKKNVLRKYSISLNPSRLGDHKILMNILEELLINCESDYVIGQIDFALLLPKEIFSLELLAKSVYVPGKQLTREFYHYNELLRAGIMRAKETNEFTALRDLDFLFSESPDSLRFNFRDDNYTFKSGQIAGYYNGTYPEVFLMYDAEILTYKEKAKRSFYQNFLNTEAPFESKYHKGFLTKYGNKIIVFEKRLNRKILKGFGITHLSDLHRIKEIKPFENIKFMDWYLRDSVLLRNQDEVSIIMFECMIRGYQQARRLLNDNNNFYRYEKELFRPLKAFKEDISLTTLFDEAFAKGISEYLGGVKIDKCAPRYTRKEIKKMILPMHELFSGSQVVDQPMYH